MKNFLCNQKNLQDWRICASPGLWKPAVASTSVQSLPKWVCGLEAAGRPFGKICFAAAQRRRSGNRALFPFASGFKSVNIAEILSGWLGGLISINHTGLTPQVDLQGGFQFCNCFQGEVLLAFENQ